MELFLTFCLGAIAVGIAMWARNTFLGFPAQAPTDYDGAGPSMDIREVLNGPLACEGVIFGPTGRV